MEGCMTTYVERGRALRAEYIRDLGERHRQRRLAETRKPGRAVFVAAFAVLALASFTWINRSERHTSASASISPTELTLKTGALPEMGSFGAP
jgi:hypothetical protein